MITIINKASDGIIYCAAKTDPIPDANVLMLLFAKCPIIMSQGEWPSDSIITKKVAGSEHSLAKSDTPLPISAVDPSLNLTTSRACILTQATSATPRKLFGMSANGWAHSLDAMF
jgi:4-coumarate--CoA ligase